MTMNIVWTFTLLLFVFTQYIHAITKPLGVPLEKLSQYKVNEPFSCIDGSQSSLPWHMVNDDYCDCRDGSDEPGTSACPNGLFYCENKNHQPLYIPSSRVNDHICDCCDGSDEYNSRATCTNTCWELGKEAREQQEQLERVMREGHRVYLENVKEAKEKMATRRARVETLDQEIRQATEVKERARVEKEAVEEKEKVVRTANEEALNAKKSVWQARQEDRKRERAFLHLDKNRDGQVDISEMQQHKEFDIDQNGEVGESEAREYLNDADSVDQAVFNSQVWAHIKEIFKPLGQKPEGEETKPSEGEHDEDKEEEGASGQLKSEEETHEDDPEPQADEFDADAKAVIAEADSARSKFDETAEALRKLEDEKRDIETSLGRDYGADAAFFLLADSQECYHMDDREYTYTLCPFRDVTQRSKSGGNEVSLGRWSRWDQGHAMQLYENGQGCWNGPARSVKVTVTCGAENKVLKVEEPSRCEYAMVFTTPAACSTLPTQESKTDSHEEL